MKKKTLVLLMLLLLLVSVPLFAAALEGIPDHRLEERMVDDANLLTDQEEANLLSLLNEISDRLEFDVVVVTASTLNGKTPMDYADDFFDYNGFGYGPGRDGALLLISMEDRDWWISTCGYGETAITARSQSYFEGRILSYLSSGDYYAAFREFAESCDYFVQLARSGQEYREPKEPFNALSSGVIAFAIGLIIALISVSSMKAKLKTVRYQPAVSFYERSGSMNVLQQEDTFLYRHVSRVRRETSTTRSSGGSHTSSSGSSHGGFGGKF